MAGADPVGGSSLSSPPLSSPSTPTLPSSSSTTTSSTPVVVPPPPNSSASIPPPVSSSPSPSIPPPASSVLPPSTSSSPPTTSSTTTSALPTTTLSNTVQTPTTNNVKTLTQTDSVVAQFSPTPTSSGTAVRTATKGFFQNKPAVGATFAIVGLIVAALLFALVTAAIRRRRAKRFDREIAEEAKRAPAPVFLDDDEYNGGGGYSSYGADPYAAQADTYAAQQYPTSDGVRSAGTVHSTSAGTGPNNYTYPSGYSDLGFSDVSSHGTYAQPPMDVQYNPPMDGQYNPPMDGQYNPGYAGYGAAGAYEMTQYAQGGHGGHQGAYAYPGEEGATGYPPVTADPLVRSKSGARGLMDSSYSGSPPPQAAKNVPSPQYADGYVAQYQTHVEDGAGAYGGMESMHGHVGGMEDEGEEEYNDGRRVLKVANE